MLMQVFHIYRGAFGMAAASHKVLRSFAHHVHFLFASLLASLADSPDVSPHT